MQIAMPTSIGGMLILIVIIAGACALASIGLKQLGWTIPPWVIQVFWVVIVVLVIVFAIRLVLSA